MDSARCVTDRVLAADERLGAALSSRSSEPGDAVNHTLAAGSS